ncbi:gamma-aminobutyric acid type B receptor subunit 1-like [Amphiura filiformis]|uniref:gamma-aminobutyric acid type B receptor subunit 1-like n=1 Tax=Amphiura filiformis TaxID=82378 RepID=UPI003B223D5F
MRTFSCNMYFIISGLFWFGQVPRIFCRTPIYLLGLYPMSGNWPGGQAYLPASQLAIQHINANTSVLPDYELVLLDRDTQCHTGRGMNAMYEELYNMSTTKLMIYGAGCAVVTDATAQASHLWNLIQISHSSASPKLSDRTLFPRLFRMFPSLSTLNPAKYALVKHYGWRKVATLHHALDGFAQPITDFVADADKYGVEIISSESFADNPALQVSNLKKQGARIILGSFYETKARQVFCEAYKEGMYGDKYVWIIYGWYTDGWWKIRDEDIDCTLEEMEAAVEGYLTVDVLSYGIGSDTGPAGITPSEFLKKYQEFVGGQEKMLKLTAYQEAPNGYDGIWTIALALKEAQRRMTAKYENKDLTSFNYDDSETMEVLFDIIEETSFRGVSGPVKFTSTGDRIGLMVVEQNQNGVEKRVAIYDTFKPGQDKFSWLKETPISWHNGEPPADSVREEEIFMAISTKAFIFMIILSSTGILLAIILLIFNLVYRNRRTIKLSSPYLNNLIIIGALLSYISIIIRGIDIGRVSLSVYLIMCKVDTWCLSIGFALAFGAMFSKTWRVHKIFTSKTAKKIVIKDVQLYGSVAVLLVIVIIILVLWEILDPLRIARQREETQVQEVGGVILVPIRHYCLSNYLSYWNGALFGVDGLLLIFGAFLAYETRHVRVPALNDSKYIGMSIYNVVILSFIGVPVSFVLDDIDAHFIIISMFLIFATTLTLCLVFIPKLMTRNQVMPSGSMMQQDDQSQQASHIPK